MNKIIKLQELSKLINEIDRIRNKRNIILLFGDLGAGKTTFVREYCNFLGIKDVVSSPSFLILNTYEFKNVVINHLDLYRVKNEEELDTIGLFDILENNSNLIFIEWPDNYLNLLKKYQKKILCIYFKFIEDNINAREIDIK
tara:strand:+ start:3473 stop:3898 length:426 start_codon:yes stop_codon:yes gene_type:complete